jgi:hypothetical protein
MVSDQSNLVLSSARGDSSNDPVPLRIFPVCATSQIAGGCHLVTTIVSNKPNEENFG